MKEHSRYTHGDLPHCKRVRGEEPSLLLPQEAEVTSPPSIAAVDADLLFALHTWYARTALPCHSSL